MNLLKVFSPKAVIRKIRFCDGHRRYRRYFKTIFPNEKYLADLRAVKIDYRPLISIIVPTYNTKKEFFVEMAESVLAQVYDNWELVIVDDASPNSGVRKLIEKYATQDQRIKYKFLKKNRHISGATNEGFKLATGEFVSLLDHDDILWPNALYEIVKSLNQNKRLDFIYTDEDKMSADGSRHRDPFLKPDWNLELLLSINYITHFTTIRKSLVDKIGGEDGKYNGAQDWELFLRATEVTKPEKIHHIPKILYSWRIHEGSTAKSFAVKDYVIDSQKRLLEAAFERRGVKKANYELYENSGVWTYKIAGTNIIHGRPDLDKIKGLALSAEEIRRNIGSYSLISYNYTHAQYDVGGKLFVPEEIYRKYW